MKIHWFSAITFAVLATAGLAHQDVQDPTVRARMENMMIMARHVETLANMARGETPFDSDSATSALIGISNAANLIVDRFENPATDPQSEARAGIWDNFADFSGRAMDLELLAGNLAGTIQRQPALGPALRQVGAACSGCHESYRINRD